MDQRLRLTLSMDVITFPWWDLSQTMLVKWAQCVPSDVPCAEYPCDGVSVPLLRRKWVYKLFINHPLRLSHMYPQTSLANFHIGSVDYRMFTNVFKNIGNYAHLRPCFIHVYTKHNSDTDSQEAFREPKTLPMSSFSRMKQFSLAKLPPRPPKNDRNPGFRWGSGKPSVFFFVSYPFPQSRIRIGKCLFIR